MFFAAFKKLHKAFGFRIFQSHHCVRSQSRKTRGGSSVSQAEPNAALGTTDGEAPHKTGCQGIAI